MGIEESRAPRVLLVEDDSGYAKTVVQILFDMNLTHASTYEKALELAKDINSFDCALVDLNLIDDRDGRGRIIISVLKKKRANFPIAAITAFDPGIGNTFETTLREIGADDIIKKSADPQHGNTLRATVQRLLEGELQPLVSQQIAATLGRITEVAREWQLRQSRSEQWRIIVRRHFGSDRVRYLADPLVRVSQSATSEFSAIQDDLLRSFGQRGSVDSINHARKRLESSLRQHDAAWSEAVSSDDSMQWTRRLAGWLIRIDLTVLVVLAGVFLSLVGEILIRWKIDKVPFSRIQITLLIGGLISGLATAALAGMGQKIHDRVQEAWGGVSDAFTVEELVAASFFRELLGIACLIVLGMSVVIYALIAL